MLLCYMDESGNTGKNLDDPNQPEFVLAGFALEPKLWGSLSGDLRAIALDEFGKPLSRDFELHASDIYQGTGSFSNVPFTKRYSALIKTLQLVPKYELTVFAIGVQKEAWKAKCEAEFGQIIDPYLEAFPFISHLVEDYLAINGRFGLMIFDEQKEHYRDVDQTLEDLRLEAVEDVKINRMVEKIMFTASHSSICIQLADVIAYCIKGMTELVHKHPMSPRKAAHIKEMFAIIGPRFHASDSFKKKTPGLLVWCDARWNGKK